MNKNNINNNKNIDEDGKRNKQSVFGGSVVQWSELGILNAKDPGSNPRLGLLNGFVLGNPMQRQIHYAL